MSGFRDVEFRRRAQARQLDERIVAFMQASAAGTEPDTAESRFEQFALELFRHQFAYNAPYRNLCAQRGLNADSIGRWQDIPPVAAASFSDARLATFPPERAELVFLSSGTTRIGDAPSTHELETSRLYDVSLLTHFQHLVMPDLSRIRMIMLAPSFAEAPHSSLSYMLSKLYETFASDGGGFFVNNETLDFEGAVRALHADNEPVLVFGTAFAFVHFMDRAQQEDLRFSLPKGSRIVETGGFKGKAREIDRAMLYEMLTKCFGVQREFCISEYGMCELGSQWYDANLADVLAGRQPRYDLKIGPSWTKILAVDPITAEPKAAGESGLLQCFDLSNRGSVAAVLTSDIALARDGGFVFVGRSPGALPKGCSITIDAMLSRS